MKNWTPEGWAIFILVSTIPFVFLVITIARLITGEHIAVEVIDLVTNLLMVIVGGVLGYLKAKRDLE